MHGCFDLRDAPQGREGIGGRTMQSTVVMEPRVDIAAMAAIVRELVAEHRRAWGRRCSPPPRRCSACGSGCVTAS